jgi:hypothetical protein
MIRSVLTTAAAPVALLLAPIQGLAQEPPQTRGAPVVAALPLAPGEEQLEIFDVRDLTGQSRLDALARDIVSDAVSTETRIVLLERYRELVESGEVRNAMQNLVTAIEELAQPRFTGPHQKVQSIGDGQLTVAGTAAQRDWVRGLLAEMRRDASPITVSALVILLPKGGLAKYLPDGIPRFVGADELAEVRARIADEERLNCPRVAVFPCQRASLSVIDQTAYIKDYSVEVVNEQMIVDPEIAVLDTGLELDLRVAPVAPGRFALRSEFSLTSARRPFATRTVQVGPNKSEVTIQLPEVEKMNVSGRFDVALGTAVLLGCFSPAGVPALHSASEEPKEVLLVVEVQRTPPAPLEVRPMK